MPIELVPVAVVSVAPDIEPVRAELFRAKPKYHTAAPTMMSSRTIQSQPIPPLVVAGAAELGAVV